MIGIGVSRFFWGINAYAHGDVAVARLRAEPAAVAPPSVPDGLFAGVIAALRAGGLPAADGWRLPPAATAVDLARVLVDGVLRQVGAPASGTVRLRPGAAHPWDVAVALENPATAEAAFLLAVGLVRAVAGGAPTAAVGASVARRLEALERSWRFWRPDVDRAEIIDACRRLKIRWKRLSYYPECIQLGEGRRHKRMLTSITGDTSHLSAQIATDKSMTNLRLAQQGVPVPRHRIVETAGKAARACRDLGFPVVVKPRDGRWNRGVAVVFFPEDVADAFAAARGAGVRGGVVVESYVHGREYRILVAAGAVCGAHERIAPAVTGDGRSTVQALIDRHNADPALVSPADAWSGPIMVLPLVERCLRWQGLDLAQIPAADRRVLVNPLPFRKHGGTYRDASDRIHPENADLAVRVARLVDLDIAGIDIRLADIERPWPEGQAGVCEVNAGPGIDNIAVAGRKRGIDVPGRLIDLVHPPAVRRPMPFILLADDAGAPDRSAALAAALGRRFGWNVAAADRAGVRIAARLLPAPASSGPRWAVERMLEEPETDAAILAYPASALLEHGVGHDRIDVAVLGDGPHADRLGRLLEDAGTRLLPADAGVDAIADLVA